MKVLKKVLAISSIGIFLSSAMLPSFAHVKEIKETKYGNSISYNEEFYVNNDIETNYQKETNNEESLYSKEYKDYLNLSVEEKEQFEVVPRKYEISFDNFFDNLKFDDDNNLSNIIDDYNRRLNNKSLSVVGSSGDAESIPEQYNLKDHININVENQGSYGLCWDFASIKSLETYLSLNGYSDIDFSELHLDYLTSTEFGGLRKLHDGGNFENFEQYLSQTNGPVLEEEVPYNANYEFKDYDNLLSIERRAYVSKTFDMPSLYKYFDENNNLIYSKTYPYINDGDNSNNNEVDIATAEEVETYRNYIKNSIMRNGGLYCTIATPDYGTAYLNSTTNSEYYNGDVNYLQSNRTFHAVTIVGWDDNYSKDNFNESMRPKNNGAYIVLNSWGEGYGNQGYYYVSYEDANIETQISGIKSATTNINEEELKQIQFEDENLYNSLKQELRNYNLYFNDERQEISLSDVVLKNINKLNLSNKGIKNISGIEQFEYLESLDLSKNEIENIESLEGINILNYLWYLDLSDNKIQEIVLTNENSFNYLGIIYLNNNEIQNINLSGLANLRELYINENQISDISFISNLRKIDTIKAQNNNIEIFPTINSIWGFVSLDLSGNKNLDLNQSHLEYAYELILSDCDIQELPNIDACVLDLSKNNNLDLSTINLDSVYELYLSNCNIDSEKISSLQSNQTLEKLDLSNNPIDSLDFLNKFRLLDLNISYTSISNLSDLKNYEFGDSYISLNASGLKNLQGIEKLTNVSDLTLDDCEITNLTDFEGLNNLLYLSLKNNNITNIDSLKDLYIKELSLDNNKNIDLSCLKDFNDLYRVSIQDCEISDITDIISNLNLTDVILNNNNVENIDILSEIENRNITIELNNNKIKSIPNLSENIYLSLKKQNIEENYELQVGITNYIEFPEIINRAYDERFKEQIILECENCELDLENRLIKIFSNRIGANEAKINIVGGSYDGSIYTFNYEMSDDIQKVGIETEYNGRTLYVQGEDFDLEGLKVYLIYDNGLMEEITDYEVENNTNLNPNQESIKVKYEDFEANIDIYVYAENDVKRIKFNDQGVYNTFILSTYDYESGLIKKDDNKLEIVITKELCDSVTSLYIDSKVSDLTGLSEFNNLNSLTIMDYCSNDLMEISKLENLIVLFINNSENTPIEDVNSLKDLTNLKNLIIWNSKIKDIDGLYNNLGLGNINISSLFDVNELENDESKVFLPVIFKELLESCDNPTLRFTFNCSTDEHEVKVDENNRYYIELDKNEYENNITSREAYIRLYDDKGIDLLILISYNLENNPDNPDNPDNPSDIINENFGYQIKDNLVVNVKSKTDLNDFIETFIGETNANIVVLDKDSNELNESIEYIGTGMKLRFKNESGEYILDENNNPITCTITVKGDANGDGIAGDIDALYMKAYRNEIQGYDLNEVQEEAMDINSDGIINYIDSNLLKLHRMEVEGYSLDNN